MTNYDVRLTSQDRFTVDLNYEVPFKQIQYSNVILDDINVQFDGNQTNFTLYANGEEYFPVNEQQLVISLDGVLQKPVIDYGVTWETPHMNMYDAHMMVADWHETDKFLYGESPFHFGEWTAVGYKWEDLNKSYRDLGGLVPLKSKVQEFFENYKAKKLA